MEYVITFESTNDAIKAERLLLDGGLHVGVMPLPGQIKAGCGIALRLGGEELPGALKILVGGEAARSGVYERRESGGKYVYNKVTDGGDADWRGY